MTSRLENLSPVPGSRHRRKRRGIGEGSGLGKTSGRGGKGQTARTGGTINRHFEGGQMPLYRRVPKVGFRSRKDVIGSNRYSLVSLAWLSNLDDGTEVTPEFLVSKGIKIKPRQSGGFKVLGSGNFSKKLTLKVHAISESARAAIENAGGSVEIIG
jgi:large subunit ribosomal protein L15